MKALAADEFRHAQSTAMTSTADAEKFVRSKMRSFAIRHPFKRLPNDVVAMIFEETALLDACTETTDGTKTL